MVSGRNTNKFRDTGFTQASGYKVSVPIIRECPVNIECRVMQEVDLSHWTLVIGEIVEVSVDIDCLGGDGKVSVTKVDPLVYIPTIREYWSIGRKLADSFKISNNDFSGEV